MYDSVNKKELPIGFMDSGLGGLSVLREAIRIMPAENYVYYGDSLNSPYGTKEEDTIQKLTFHAVEKLVQYGIKGLVIACNTATGAAIRPLRIKYPDLPIVGIEPAIKPAVMNSRGGRILVMATPMAIQLQKFQKLLELYKNQADIIPIPCKGLMEFVEAGNIEGNDLDEYFKRTLEPFLSLDTETIVLGCTHYSFLKHHIEEFLGNRHIHLIDGNLGTSLEIKRQLKELNLLQDEMHQGNIEILNSTKRQDMIDLSWKLLHLI